MIETGMIAPEFALPADDGRMIQLSDCRGKSVILFFYPRDNTSGCTTEAREFSEHLSEFEAANTLVFGISKDTLTSHVKFRTKHGLTVPLLSDADTTACESYGVWKEKKMYGKTFMGIVRTTVLIDGNGVLKRIWDKVKVPGHVADVLAEVRGQ